MQNHTNTYFVITSYSIHYTKLYEVVSSIKESDYSTFFVFDHWAARNNFFKYFISGAFITIVMTGLDQDMMQKNLTCKNVSEAKRNMYWYGFAFIPVNLMILVLGALLFIFVQQQGISMPERPDDLFPIIATKGYLPEMVGVFFVLGLVAAAYSSADSALTSLTRITSYNVCYTKLLRISIFRYQGLDGKCLHHFVKQNSQL